ncbi:LCP family protein [Oceanobacillus sp. FSL K6-2867]|uniref:LCP family glycopolymer transferase n=1 Tax=Oceanobacillus sp. FSL K6-2867 TaxID=2954748 RepID=UPI0030DCDA2B
MNKSMLKKTVLIVVIVLIVGAAAIGSYAWKLFSSAMTNIQEEIDYKRSDEQLQGTDLAEGHPISVLLMGIDEPERKDDIYRRSDTLIYLTLNPQTKSTHMVSIPRDTLTEIVGHGTEDKINHSYAFGGTAMALRTVEKFLGAPIDYYVKVDMRGFQDIVDTVNGIDVTNPFEFTQGNFTFEEGPIHLGGEEALSYIRMIKEDPKGDFGPQKRQRQVIQALLEKGTTIPGLTSSISNLEEIITTVEDNVRTNLDLKEMWDIQKNYSDALNHIEEHEIVGEEIEKNKTFYYVPDESEMERLSEELNGQLWR